MHMPEFADKRIIVTGAGWGIGRSAAMMFAEQGALVLIADDDADAAFGAAHEIRAAGLTAHAVAGDLSDTAIIDRIVATAATEFGGIDVLIHNAGYMDELSAAADVSDAAWERALRVNLTAPFLLTRAVLPYMLAQGGGSIVFTASESSLRGRGVGAAYAASKHAVAGLARSIAAAYHDRGIRANAIRPGATMTDIEFHAAIGDLDPTVPAPYTRDPGRPALADEQAEAIVYLASQAADNINGAVLRPSDAALSRPR